jgi:hypothetical protein
MEWPVVVALAVVIPLILVPFLLVWYLNIRGAYVAAREGIGSRLFQKAGQSVRITLSLVVPVVVYGLAVWLSVTLSGWLVALVVAIALPVILVVAALVWVFLVSGLYEVARGALQRRVTGPRQRVVTPGKESMPEKVS